MSKWQAEKAKRNRRSLARLNRALPSIFPSAVLSWALSRPFVPPTPRLAMIRIGAPTRFAPIGWRVRLLLGAERPAAGLGARRRRQAWIASHISNATRALSRTRIHPGSGILLRVRPTGLSIRLACRSVGHRRQHECELALRLCDCVAILECAE